jgi:hypothetical protein
MSDNNSSTGTWKAIWEVLKNIPYIGKLLSALSGIGDANQKLIILAFFGCLFLFVIYPLLIPILAATYINKGFLADMHEPYASKVREAFRVREASEIANRGLYDRLDYVYPLSFIMDTRNTKQYILPINPGQRVIFEVENAALRTKDPATCPVPDELAGKGADLLDLRLSSVRDALFQISNGDSSETYSLSKDYWIKIKNSNSEQNGRLSLVFAPTKELRTKCSALEVEVKLMIKVFKDLVLPSES